MLPFLLIQLIASTYFLSPVRALKTNNGIQGNLINEKLKDVANNIDNFAFNLRMEIDKLYMENENYVFSPLTVFTTIASYGMGAEGATLKEISKVLNTKSFKSSIARLDHFYKKLKGMNGNDSGMNILNELITPIDFEASKKYIQLLEENFSMHHLTSKSRKKKKESSITKSKYISDMNGMKMEANTTLPSFVGESGVGERMEVRNSLRSQYKWKWMFPKENSLRIFRYSNGRSEFPLTKQIPSMTACSKFPTYYDGDLMIDVIALPLADSNGHVIFAKNLGKFYWRNVYRRIDYRVFTKWMNGLKQNQPKTICAYIPKFKMTHTLHNFTEILKNLGVRQLLTPSANLSGINKQKKLRCSSPFNKATFEIKEDGKEKIESFDGRGETPRYILGTPFLFWVVAGKFDTTVLSGRIMNADSLEFHVTPRDTRQNEKRGEGFEKEEDVGKKLFVRDKTGGSINNMPMVLKVFCVVILGLFAY